MTKKVVSKVMDTMFVVMFIAKVAAVAYLLGLCGGFENGSITGKDFLIRAVITIVFICIG